MKAWNLCYNAAMASSAAPGMFILVCTMQCIENWVWWCRSEHRSTYKHLYYNLYLWSMFKFKSPKIMNIIHGTWSVGWPGCHEQLYNAMSAERKDSECQVSTDLDWQGQGAFSVYDLVAGCVDANEQRTAFGLKAEDLQTYVLKYFCWDLASRPLHARINPSTGLVWCFASSRTMLLDIERRTVWGHHWISLAELWAYNKQPLSPRGAEIIGKSVGNFVLEAGLPAALASLLRDALASASTQICQQKKWFMHDHF